MPVTRVPDSCLMSAGNADLELPDLIVFQEKLEIQIFMGMAVDFFKY